MEIVISAAPGSHGATLDWKDAFRNIPVRLEDLWMTIIAWPSKGPNTRFFVDRAHKFGNARSPGNCDRPNQAFMTIVRRLNFEDLLAWVDDIFARRQPVNPFPPWHYSFDI
jgi:hypothetical protein